MEKRAMKMKRLKKIVKKIFKKKYFVFGDSHTEVFQYINKKDLLRFIEFEVTLVGGATAQGMRNPNSKTNALEIFSNKIYSLSKKSTLFFLLGEVDTGFVIWYRALKYQESVEVQLLESINHYIKFLEQIIRDGYKKIIVISAPLPTILDDQDWGEVANLRKTVKATLRERTDLTLEYNKILRQKVIDLGCDFLCTDEYLLNTSTGVIDDRFRNKDKNNHHLDLENYADVIIQVQNEK